MSESDFAPQEIKNSNRHISSISEEERNLQTYTPPLLRLPDKIKITPANQQPVKFHPHNS
ncbi:MAG: hypothetical protein IJI25_10495 [Eubacterium sp.]|nr:hypothetical protein [Eubacterium sp.]